MLLVPGGRPARPARRLVIRPRPRQSAGPRRRPPPGTSAGRQTTRARCTAPPGPVTAAGICLGRPGGQLPGRRVGSPDLPRHLPTLIGPKPQVSSEMYLAGGAQTDDNSITFFCVRGGHGGARQGRGRAAGRTCTPDRPGPAAGPPGRHPPGADHRSARRARVREHHHRAAPALGAGADRAAAPLPAAPAHRLGTVALRARPDRRCAARSRGPGREPVGAAGPRRLAARPGTLPPG